MQTSGQTQCPDQISGVNNANVPISGMSPAIQPPVPQTQGGGGLALGLGLPQIQVPDGTQQFCLRWNSYPATVATQLAALRATEDFVDVTLACEGRQLRAHKLVLSACSPYFMQLFKSTPCKHPVIFLRDVGFRQLVALLEFMYAGEVNVSQTDLPTLLRTAEALQVRGLADTNTNNNTINDNNNYQQQPNLPQKPIFPPPQQMQNYSAPAPLPPVPMMQQSQQIFNPPPQQCPPANLPQQHSQNTNINTNLNLAQQQPVPIPIETQVQQLQQQQQQSVLTNNGNGDHIPRSSPAPGPGPNSPMNQNKSHRRKKSSSSHPGARNREHEDSSSDSNYTPESFTELKPVHKISGNSSKILSLNPSGSSSTGNLLEQANSLNVNSAPTSGTSTIEQTQNEQNSDLGRQQESLMGFDGIGNLGGSGNQSEEEEEETSEDEDEDMDDDDDDGEIKEFYHHPSDPDGAFNIDPNDGNPDELIPGTSSAGNSGAAPLGIKNPELGSGSSISSTKDEAAIADKVQRSRLSRSLWPPGLPYHGPQQCPYCTRVLSNVGNWRKHVVTMHFAREKTYKCRHCNSSFRTAEYLQKHYVRVHNYPPKMTRKKYVEHP